MAASPLSGSDGPVTVVIRSDGNPIPDSAQVLSVRVRAESNRVPEAQIVVADGDVATGAFPLTDGALFKPGAAIAIAAGYGDAAPETIFEGVVVTQRLRIDADNLSRLEVGCRDKAFKLTLGRRSRVFRDQKDSDAVARLIGEAGLSSDVEATTATRTDLVQYDCTDWDFILSRAEANGCLVNVKAGKLTIKPPDASAAAALTVTYGLDLVRFDAELDARTQYASVDTYGWDIATQLAATGTAAAASAVTWGDLTPGTLAAVGGLDSYRMQSAAPLGTDVLTALARARQGRAGLARLRGTVRFQGSARAEPGAVLELAGLGARFGGTGIVCSVIHRIEAGAWLTEAGLGLAPEWLHERAGGQSGDASFAAAARGLHIGKVAKLTEDPSAEKLIQVTLPLLGDGTEAVWARFGNAYASNGCGAMFLPEIGDEVVVGFLNEDPSYAIVLGSLHSSVNAPPVEATEDNNIKTILTRTRLKLEFDEENKIVTLATPAGNSVVLDDAAETVTLKDKAGNSIELASGGITLDSKGDVTIKATGKVAVEATGDATLKGMNVTATAQTSFSASGNASAEVKASGTMTVKGALVQIN
jgi:Rhs element Vgr protein